MAELEPEHLRKVFIGGLPPATTDDSMRDYFSKYGKIVDCVVMKDSQTRRSRGFGFVAFDHSSCVDELQSDRPHILDGKEVDTKRVVPKSGGGGGGGPRTDREQKVNKVFLGGLRDEITDEDIRQFFGQFGIVEKVETFMDRERNKRKGFAFITFQDFDSVDKCVLQAQTTPDGKLNLQGFKVEVKKAKSQDEMRGFNRGGGGMGRGGGGGGRGGFNSRGGGGGYGDYGNQYNQGGYQGGYNNQGGGYNNQGGGYNGGYSNQGGGQGDYDGGYNNSGNWGGQSQGWGSGGGGGGGGYQNNGFGGGYGNNSGGGGPMRGGYNKGGNRPGPYSGGGGGNWRN